MQFDIDGLKTAKYFDFVTNDKNLVLSCKVQDNSGNIAYIKNLVWENDKATGCMLMDKPEKPDEIYLLEKDTNENIKIIRTITNLIYNDNGKAVSFVKTDDSGNVFNVFNIEYDSLDRIIYCKQKDKSGTEREFSDFLFDKDGKFLSCKSLITGSEYKNIVSSKVLKYADRPAVIKDLLENMSNKKEEELTDEEKHDLLQFITSIVQILDSAKSVKVNEFQQNMGKSDILHPRYKLETPLLQVFNSVDTAQSNIIGEKNIDRIIQIIQNKISGKRSSDFAKDHVLVKIAGNLSKLLLNKVFEGNYHVTENGEKIINLGFNLHAEEESEAIELAIRHLYYNSKYLLSCDEIMPFHYKSLDNFLLIKL